VKRGESEAEMGRLKLFIRHNMLLVLSLTFLRGPPGPLLGPLRTPGPRLQFPSGIQDLPRAVLLDDCQKSQTGPKSIDSKETRLF